MELACLQCRLHATPHVSHYVLNRQTKVFAIRVLQLIMGYLVGHGIALAAGERRAAGCRVGSPYYVAGGTRIGYSGYS